MADFKALADITQANTDFQAGDLFFIERGGTADKRTFTQMQTGLLGANVSSLAGLTLAANKGLYSTGANTLALFDLTAAGLALLDDADPAAQRTTLELGTAATLASIDEDDMASDSATAVPTQQSVKAYVDAEVAGFSAFEYSWHPYNRTAVGGSETGIFYDHSVDGTPASIETPDFVADFDYMVVFTGVGTATLTAGMGFEVYKDTDAAYGSLSNIGSSTLVTTNDHLNGYVSMQNPKGWSRSRAGVSYAVQSEAEIASDFVAVLDNTVQTYSKMRFTLAGGRNFGAGQVALLRRRVIWPF